MKIELDKIEIYYLIAAIRDRRQVLRSQVDVHSKTRIDVQLEDLDQLAHKLRMMTIKKEDDA